MREDVSGSLDDRIQQVTQSLFSASCMTVVRRVDDHENECLLLSESQLVEKAAEKRKNEFKAGRAAARAALSLLDVGACELLRGEGGEPLWPQGVTGSLSHADGWCIAVTARASEVEGLGVDLETVSRMSDGVARRILRPDEVSALESAGVDLLQGASRVFSAKEAVYKALYPNVRQYIGFQEAEIIFEGHDGQEQVFAVKLFHSDPVVNAYAPRLTGRVAVCDKWVIAGVVLQR